MTNEQNRIKSLELEIKEQRRDYDILHSLHEALKIKNLTFLATSFGVLGYLYTGNGNSVTQQATEQALSSTQKALFIPSQAYGVVLYLAGLMLILGAVTGFILVIVKRRAWHTAYDNDIESRYENKHNNYEKYLRHMSKRYLEVSISNGNCYEKRSYLLNNSFIALIIGASIMLTIKTLGG